MASKRLPINTSYWDGGGKYRPHAIALEALVGAKDRPADSVAGEIFRLGYNVYFWHFNGGGGFYSAPVLKDAGALRKLLRERKVSFAVPTAKDPESWHDMLNVVIQTALNELFNDKSALRRFSKVYLAEPSAK